MSMRDEWFVSPTHGERIAVLTLHRESHLDHALSQEQIGHLLALFKDKDGFFIETVTLPAELGTVPCGLYGPVMGDEPVPESEVVYEQRDRRAYSSRLVKRQSRPCRQITVIAGPQDGQNCVLFTAFGGQQAPQELGDPNLKNAALIEQARAFWREHAIAK